MLLTNRVTNSLHCKEGIKLTNKKRIILPIFWKILSLVEQEVRLFKNVNNEVASLTRNLGAIQDVLQDAEERQVKEANVRRWLNDVKEVSCEMDNVLDEWSTEILKQKFEKEEKEGEISIDLTKKKKAKRDVEQLERLKSSSIVDKFGTFGRDNEKNILVSKLLSENSHERGGPLVIPIVGMGWIGKTTFAQLAFSDEMVKAYFEKRIWVCVSEPFEQVRVAKAIVEGIDGNSTTPIPNELEALVRRICKSIEGKKFLLVLNDVWDADYRKWEPLMHSLQLGALGSRTVVTTRKEQVAAIIGSATHVIHLKELSEEVSRSLFFHIAFFGKERNETGKFEKYWQQNRKEV
ncbi:disease resistance protein RGA2-like [Pyrus communis]|uniref:disease resistance protein RGA2-like n=1 Tax=Pyrus communis TaxID=23211 RepID=UPI0035C0CEAE